MESSLSPTFSKYVSLWKMKRRMKESKKQKHHWWNENRWSFAKAGNRRQSPIDLAPRQVDLGFPLALAHCFESHLQELRESATKTGKDFGIASPLSLPILGAHLPPEEPWLRPTQVHRTSLSFARHAWAITLTCAWYGPIFGAPTIFDGLPVHTVALTPAIPHFVTI